MTTSNARADVRAGAHIPAAAARPKFSPRARPSPYPKDPEKPDLKLVPPVADPATQVLAHTENDHTPSNKTTVESVSNVDQDVYTDRGVAGHFRDLVQSVRESDINKPAPTVAELLESGWPALQEDARGSRIIQSGQIGLLLLQILGVGVFDSARNTLFANKTTTGITYGLALLVVLILAAL